ncbi:NUDIX hydrolase [Halococcus agarilyticus]|uniref:NUDIX hydrolase n=1 Tax=Halococcus agarilyticus TaxID=1232219 RepID=UPI0006780DBF|nr:NUDIX hydrolase [Halococcus agarilyticus]
MTTENDARAAVGAERERLRERFGAFAVTETRVENDPAFYEYGLDLVRESGMLADAGALVRDSRDRVLLVRHPDTPETWGTPGGGYETADDSLAATAVREVREETGVRCEVTDVLAIRVKTIEHSEEPRSYPMLTAEFAAHSAEGSGVRSRQPASATDDDEVLEARWFVEPPAALHDRTRDLLGE